MRSIRIVFALLLVTTAAQAQKRALTQADWDRWNSISGASLTNDGRWAVYTVAPLVGDGELIARSTSGSTEYRVARGYLGRPNNTPGGLRPRSANPEAEPSGPTIAAAQLTPDSRHVLVMTYPPQREFDAAARDRRRNAGLQNRTELAILRLSDGQVTRVPRVRSVRVPKSSGEWIAYVLADSATTDSSVRAAPRSGARRRFGSTLVLRHMGTGREDRVEDVLDFAFDDSAKVLAYTVVSRAENRDGAYARLLGAQRTFALLTGRGDYDQIAVDRGGTQIAFISNRDGFGGDAPASTLYHATLRDGGARAAVTPSALGGMRVAENANVSFTRAGAAVLFGIAPPRVDTLVADSLVGKSVFDLWHYRDEYLQPTQRVMAARDRNQSFRAIYHPATHRFVRLANDSIPQVAVSSDGRVAVASSDERYAMMRLWGGDANDVYVIDALTGATRLIGDSIDGTGRLSPEGRYVIFYHGGKWFSHAVATGRTVEITAPLKGVSFAREIHDRPSPAPAWGIAGWTRGDRSVLVYDRYDIWELDPAGARAPVMVTDSVGRRNHMSLRLAIGGSGGGGFGGFGGFGGGGDDEDDDAIDPAKPLLLSAFDDDTKASGFYRDRLGVGRAPERIVMADAAHGRVIKAADAEQYLVTRGTFVDFPNLYTGSSLASLTRISDANPQQKDYHWGTVELVSWVSTDGVPLHGLLFKPENFDPAKKYPMVTYFYEKLSQNLHSYVAPNGRNVINPTHYVSNGYLVFEPDIHYEEGYPGPSAMKSIIPGIQMLLARPYVDPNALGVNGQSWGGYQALYMITQTRIFRAAMTGAPVVNMTSAYGGIRWGSGVARPAMYETGQSRIGGSLWEFPMRFFENSPLFWLDKVTTPLLIMHNDADDAVPWYQGIETFVALRRLGKEVYLINYNNDVHNPQSRANQKDIAMRMQQFFDAKLKGAPAPDWMVRGIPYVAKGKDQVPEPVQAGKITP
jgi:dienelactone hydrolase